ncbi:G2/M phase-specific E3 ubiquitin-protein ligase-like isoform X1, partial [Clarias magur]
SLYDLQITVKLVQSQTESDEHPIDKHYRALNCVLQLLDSEPHEYKDPVVYCLFGRGPFLDTLDCPFGHFGTVEEDLVTILMNFQDHLSDDQVSIICVRRKKLLESAIKAISRDSFCWTYSPQIELLMIEVQTTLCIFEGKGGQVFLSDDQAALDQRKYFKDGNLITGLVAHRRPCIKALDSTLFQLLCGQEPPLEQFDYRVLPDPDVQSQVKRILQCKSVGDLTVLQQDSGDWIAECGVLGIFSATVEDMPKISVYVVKHYIFL